MANEKRVRYDFRRGTLSAAITAAATSFSSAEMLTVPSIGVNEHFPITLDPLGENGAPEVIYVTFRFAPDVASTVVRGQENTTARAHPAGTKWVHAPTSLDFNRGGEVQFKKRTAGNLLLASTSIAPVDTGLDLAIFAEVGDNVEVSLNCKVGSQANGIYFNAVGLDSLISLSKQGDIANYDQVPGWTANGGSFHAIGGSWFYKLVAADVVNSRFRVGLHYTTDTTSPTRTVEATAAVPLQFAVKNLGQR